MTAVLDADDSEEPVLDELELPLSPLRSNDLQENDEGFWETWAERVDILELDGLTRREAEALAHLERMFLYVFHANAE